MSSSQFFHHFLLLSSIFTPFIAIFLRNSGLRSRKTMALGSYQSQVSDKVHTDVLSEARNSCYKARDSFYACLEKESSKKPTEIASVGLLYPVECKKSRQDFEKLCRPTWVKHFDRQYCAKKRVQRLLDTDERRRGPISLPEPSTFKP